LRRQLPAVLAEEYPRARRRASTQTGLPFAAFPEVCPWTAAQVLDEDFWSGTDAPNVCVPSHFPTS
jgi:hypothetical protein